MLRAEQAAAGARALTCGRPRSDFAAPLPAGAFSTLFCACRTSPRSVANAFLLDDDMATAVAPRSAARRSKGAPRCAGGGACV